MYVLKLLISLAALTNPRLHPILRSRRLEVRLINILYPILEQHVLHPYEEPWWLDLGCGRRTRWLQHRLVEPDYLRHSRYIHCQHLGTNFDRVCHWYCCRWKQHRQLLLRWPKLDCRRCHTYGAYCQR